MGTLRRLSSEAIQGTPLPLESIDNIHSSNSLPLGMLSVGDGVPDHVLQEHLQDRKVPTDTLLMHHLQNTPGLLVDQARDSLDATPSCKSSDGRLRDALEHGGVRIITVENTNLDVVPQDFPVSLGSSLAKTLASFSTSGHDTEM